jgi:hypothetical protein
LTIGEVARQIEEGVKGGPEAFDEAIWSDLKR